MSAAAATRPESALADEGRRDLAAALQAAPVVAVSVRFAARRNAKPAAGGFRDDGDRHRGEFEDLVRSAGLTIGALVTARRDRPHARWFVGAGKVEEIEAAIAAAGAKVALFNHELAPAQQRNLERRLACRTMTRTELILHVFAARARTHEGKLQVELAQLTHAQTRLIRGWTHLDRQTGVGGAGGRTAGGRIGGAVQRGAGETQLEMDQRMLGVRVRQVRARLANVRRRRAQNRRRRSRARVPTVALAGYTNAGKSTLFNALTGANERAENRLFATLDPTMRRLADPEAEVVVADTVGFIRALPISLIDAFKATLEEVTEADLILHVIDAAAPDQDDLRAEVQRILAEIGADAVPTLEVLNKVDLLEEGADAVPGQVPVSALTGEGLAALREAILVRLGLSAVAVELSLPPHGGSVRSWLYRHGEVLRETVDDCGAMAFSVRLPPGKLPDLAAYDRNGLVDRIG